MERGGPDNVDSPHTVRLGDTSWFMWRECVVRSAGLPVTGIEAFCDQELTKLAENATVDGEHRQKFERRWPGAVQEQRAAARSLANTPWFREAVTWQTPTVVRNCLDARRFGRRHELVVVRYAQRYMAKNETIGFFGPLAWASWSDDPYGVRAVPGRSVVRRRRVYFESWAIDSLARTLAQDPELSPWLRVRLVESCALDGTNVLRPYGEPLHLSADQAALLARCDGTRTAQELAAEAAVPLETALAEFRDWCASGVVHLGFEGPVEAHPEVTFRKKLVAIGDARLRERALARLSRLEDARSRVARAAGQPDALATTMNALNQTFEEETGVAATRRPGETYAGRTLVYEDSNREVQVRLGRDLRHRLAAPLAIVLSSARWLVARAAELYEATMLDTFELCAKRLGSESVPLATIVSALTPHLAGKHPRPLRRALAEFHDRWARVMPVPEGARRHSVAAESLLEAVSTEFPARPAPWASAVYYSPDIMLTGAGPEASSANGAFAVLGEVHLATNTLESRMFVEAHEEPARLLKYTELDLGPRRAYLVPPKEWPDVSARTYPSALLSPQFTYWCLHSDSAGAPGGVVPAADLVVHRADPLVVRSAKNDTEFQLTELLGEPLSNVLANAFAIMPQASHRPRVSIGDFVVQRESWMFDVRDMSWALCADQSTRFQNAQEWRCAHSLPTRGFYRVTGERKPVLVDFRSIALVDLLARVAKQAAGRPQPQSLSLTEMLPDLYDTWLADANGDHYTAELRCVVVDRAGSETNK